VLFVAQYLKPAFLALLVGIAGYTGYSTSLEAKERTPCQSIATISASELPPEARHTLMLIQKGGPFPFPQKDGSIFGNFEKHLPLRERGYYRAYTVPTPGVSGRGTRRIVAGKGLTGSVATSGVYYYTDDHYRTFRRIRE